MTLSRPSAPVNAPPTGAEGLPTTADSAVPGVMIAGREEIIQKRAITSEASAD
jgi:hypothetical protein